MKPVISFSRAQIAPRVLGGHRKPLKITQSPCILRKQSRCASEKTVCHVSSFLAFVPPVSTCFDQECQASKDTFFILSIAIPLLVFGSFTAYLIGRRRDGIVSLDSNEYTGTSKYEVDAEEQSLVARDAKGEIAYRAVRYTPWLTEQGPDDECIRINVGPVGRTLPKSYLFDKILREPSQLVTVTLPKPLGIIFEEDPRLKRVFVAEFVPDSEAESQSKKAALDPSISNKVPAVGDVLRALTTTVVTYKEGALIAQGPEREIVVFGADGQKFSDVAAAMKRSYVSDGPVTLVLERPLQQV
ncbi:hypothetical protein M9434_000275 [Picochlorum sp. BPE23]|nr:hypothetical protein M9434_000275 [Picochlorum sp. BPE23]KAI8106306.1 hypothetical protein M9435_000852 [Picochlorum sp. BPE23]